MKKYFKYVLNVLLCIVCSLPVITLMDSVTAMHFVNFKLRDDADTDVVKEFFKSYKTNIVPSLVLTVVFGAIGVFLTRGWMDALKDFSDINKTEVTLKAVATFMFFIFESFSTYILAKFDNPFKRYIIVVVFAISAGIDVAVKMAIFEMAMVAAGVFIVLVNPGALILSVATVVLLLLLALYEMFAGAWIVPVFSILLNTQNKAQEAKESNETETQESSEAVSESDMEVSEAVSEEEK